MANGDCQMGGEGVQTSLMLHCSTHFNYAHENVKIWFLVFQMDECGQELLYLGDDDKAAEGTANIFEPLFHGKLNHITNKHYPQSEEQKLAVTEEAKRKVGLKEYDPLSQNCQHLITSLLVGTGYSEDARDKTLIASFLSVLVRDSPELGVKMLIKLFTTFSIHLSRLVPIHGWGEAFKLAIAGGSAEGFKGFCSNSFTELQNLQYGAQAACGALAIPAVIELLFILIHLCHDFYQVFKAEGKEANDKAWKSLKTNLKTNVTAGVGSLIGTFFGSLIGLAIPLPGAMIVCSALGGFLGRGIGKWVAEIFYGTKHAEVTNFETHVDDKPAACSG